MTSKTITALSIRDGPDANDITDAFSISSWTQGSDTKQYVSTVTAIKAGPMKLQLQAQANTFSASDQNDDGTSDKFGLDLCMFRSIQDSWSCVPTRTGNQAKHGIQSLAEYVRLTNLQNHAFVALDAIIVCIC